MSGWTLTTAQGTINLVGSPIVTGRDENGHPMFRVELEDGTKGRLLRLEDNPEYGWTLEYEASE